MTTQLSIEQLGITSLVAHEVLVQVVDGNREVVIVHSDWNGERHIYVQSLPLPKDDFVSETHAYALYLPTLEDMLVLSEKGRAIERSEIARTSQLSRHA